MSRDKCETDDCSGDSGGRDGFEETQQEGAGLRGQKTERPGEQDGHDLCSETTVRPGEQGEEMGRCWRHSQHHVEEAQNTDGGPIVPSHFHFPHKVFWPSFMAFLLLFILVFSLAGTFTTQQPSSQSQQIVRFSGFMINQSAIVDQQKDRVTFYVASAENQTSTVLFDVRRGLICYKPPNQDACFLQKMEESDYDNVRSFLLEPKQQGQCLLTANETLRQTEFLGVLGSSPVDVSTLDESLQQLCQDRSVHWTHRTEGPGKQRLVYFCIDICFPSNICVSVCFYYLPE